jgi:hypothetical protein
VRSFDAADTRHIDIHEDDIDATPVVTTPADSRFTTVKRFYNLDTRLCTEQALEAKTYQVVVIYDENFNWCFVITIRHLK